MGSILSNKSHFEAKVNLDGGSRVSISASRTKGVLRNYGSTLKSNVMSTITYLPFLVRSNLFAEREFAERESLVKKRELGYEEIQVDTVPSQRSDSRFLLP